MKLSYRLQKEGLYERYPDIFKETHTKPHRPQKRFKLIVNSREDAKKAVKAGIPILWIDTSYTKVLRYPMRIPDTIVVPREYKEVVESGLNVHTFESMTPFKDDTIIPDFEEVVVFMLKLDPLAARAMVDRSDINKIYLQKRIIQEELEREASEVYLHDYLDIPVIETDMRREDILKVIDRNKIREVIP